MSSKKIQFGIFIIFFLANVHGKQCNPMYTQPNMRLNNNIFQTVIASSRTECSSQCSSNSLCLSTNYHQGHNKCELNKGSHLSNPEALLPAEGYVYTQADKTPSKCSAKLCSEPKKCVPRGNDYECVSSCEASGYGRKSIMTFPRKSTSDYVQWENPFEPLAAFTISFWVQMQTGADYQSIFSYSSVNVSSNTILIQSTYMDITIMIMGDKSEPAVKIMDGLLYHVALTWTSTTGQWILYVNGTKKGEGNIEAGQKIPKGGLILGQDQDSYMGGFEQEQSLQGNLTDVNVWNKVFTGPEIQAQYSSKCSPVEGNAVKWADLLGRKKGQVQVECRSVCG